MTESFVVGDTVQLKSGGTKMTVEKIDTEGVMCVWFEGTNVQRGSFVAGTLKKAGMKINKEAIAVMGSRKVF